MLRQKMTRAMCGAALAVLAIAMGSAAQAQTVTVSNQTQLAGAIDQANAGADVTVQSPAGSSTSIILTGSLPTLNAGSITLGSGNFRNVSITGGSWIINRPLNILNTATSVSPFRTSTNLSGTGSVSIGSPGGRSSVVFSGANTYSGGTTIVGGATLNNAGVFLRSYYNQNELIIDSSGALPASGPIALRGSGTLTLNFATTQAILNRVSSDSVGTIATAANVTTSGTLDLSGLPNVSLGASRYGSGSGFTIANSTLTATIIPANNTYRLGGGDGFLVVDSVLANQGATPARVLITGGNTRLRAANTYTGGTQVQFGTLHLANPGALGGSGANLQIDAGAGVVVDFTLNQAFLDRVTPASTGSISLAVQTNSNPLDFTNLPGLSLGGSSGNDVSGNTLISAYSGVLTPGGNTYRLGGNTTIRVDSLLSGANALVVSGNNAPGIQGVGVVLTNTNTYTGLTTINPNAALILGNLTAGLNGQLLNTSGIVNNGTLQFSNTAATTFDRVISGSGGIIQAGPGAVTLTAANSYTGETRIERILRLGAGASIANSSRVTLSAPSSNVPELDLQAAGSQTIRNLDGSGFVTLGTGSTLTLRSTSADPFLAPVFGGTVRGAGNLVFEGPDAHYLDGTSTYTGTTRVNGGSLYVNGSIASSSLSTIASGATLGGTGTVGSTTILSGGTLSPGDGPAGFSGLPNGTLTVNGNLVFNAGSTFRVDVGSTQATTDRVIVTGTASLAGSVQAFSVGTVFTAGTYTLLTANGGRTGTFSGLTTMPAGVGTLSYTANNVFLTVNAGPTDSFVASTRDVLIFNPATVTTNRTNAFSTQIIGRLLGGTPLYDQTFAAAFSSAAVQNGVTAARAAITTAGGPGIIIGDPVRTSSTTTSTIVTGASTYALAGPGVQTVSTVTTFGPATVQIGALSTCNVASLPSTTRPTCTTGGTAFAVGDDETNFNTTQTTTYTINENRTDTVTDTLRETYELNGQVVAVGSVHAEVQSGLFDLSGRLLGRLGRVEAGTAGWADVYGFRVNQGGRRAALGIAGGFGIGVAPGLTLALGIDRGRIDIDVAGALETGRVELTEIGGALRFDSGPFAASLALVQGFGNANTRRAIIGASTATYDVRVTGMAFEAGYATATGGWMVRPEAGIDWVRVSASGFTETDTLGLVVAGGAARQVRATAGLSVGRDFGLFSLSVRARYLAVLEGTARSVPVAFALSPTRPLTMTAPGEPNGALLGARIGVPLGARATFSAGYDGRLGGGYTSHTATASVRVAF